MFRHLRLVLLVAKDSLFIAFDKDLEIRIDQLFSHRRGDGGAAIELLLFTAEPEGLLGHGERGWGWIWCVLGVLVGVFGETALSSESFRVCYFLHAREQIRLDDHRDRDFGAETAARRPLQDSDASHWARTPGPRHSIVLVSVNMPGRVKKRSPLKAPGKSLLIMQT